MQLIPVYRPSLLGNEKKYVNDCLDSSWISSKGKYIELFESAFSHYTGINHSIAVSNGTVAIHLALAALCIGPGDEVIVPTLTYIASVNAITYTGATPVFADSCQETWQVSVDSIELRLTPRTKAVLVVHLYGQVCDTKAIRLLCDKYNLFLVEDCAEAFGSKYEDVHVGNLGHIATFSFFGNKTITTGEGGMVCANDQTLAERCRKLKGQGLALYREYWHDVVGYNYRMTNICAAIGLAQLERANQFLEKKRNLYEKYVNCLSGLPLKFLGEQPNTVNSFWMINIALDNARDRDPLRDFLRLNRVETRPVFYPVHTMPIYSNKFESHPVAEDIARRGISLPSWPELPDSDLARITESIHAYFANHS
jgi:perosamine synthetase